MNYWVQSSLNDPNLNMKICIQTKLVRKGKLLSLGQFSYFFKQWAVFSLASFFFGQALGCFNRTSGSCTNEFKLVWWLLSIHYRNTLPGLGCSNLNGRSITNSPPIAANRAVTLTQYDMTMPDPPTSLTSPLLNNEFKLDWWLLSINYYHYHIILPVR